MYKKYICICGGIYKNNKKFIINIKNKLILKYFLYFWDVFLINEGYIFPGDGIIYKK